MGLTSSGRTCLDSSKTTTGTRVGPTFATPGCGAYAAAAAADVVELVEIPVRAVGREEIPAVV
ncbi:hypothetical protein FMEAI12_6020006 [Parafrankia sp. Ea1.12]|nr:hypothetical protein FMEAI12_6020006 [Parafrankia sp. Ea1.12]